MLKSDRWKPICIASFAVLGLTLAFTRVQTAEAGAQPNMEDARAHLQNATSYLQRAEHNKGGHRAKAQQLTQEAIREVNEGINYADK